MDRQCINKYITQNSNDKTAIEAIGNIKHYPKWLWRNRIITDLIEELEKRFISDFGTSVCKVLFFDGEINKLPKGRVVGKDLAIKSLGELIKPNQIYSGPIDVDSKAKKFLFGNKESIKECVLVSLKTKSVTAILMLGSDTNDKYSPEKDSLFLEFISDVASSLIDRHNN